MPTSGTVPRDKSARFFRREMVDHLVERKAIESAAVRQAFLDIPRELFVPEIVARDGIEAIYRPDVALPVARDAQGVAISSSSAPSIMAPMLEALSLGPGLRVLEVGAGTGYNAALLKELVGLPGRVTSIDLDAAIAQRARRALSLSGRRCRVLVGDGRSGAPSQAPFDRIIVTASACEAPRAWRDQLVEGGLLEVPLRLNSECFGLQIVATFRREAERLRSVRVLIGGFMALRDPARPLPSVPGLQVVARKTSSETLISIEGGFVRGLGKPTIQRVLATMLGPHRRIRRLTFKAADGLIRFLGWSSLRRAGFCFVGGRYGVLTVSADGRSVAAVLAQYGKSGWIETWGNREAEQELDAYVQQWERTGRPTLEDLEITIGYARRPGRGWKTLRLSDAFIKLDWATRSTARSRSQRSEAGG